MADFFGYNRAAKSTNEIASSEALTVAGIGGADLIQNISIQYGQQIRPLFAVGNSNIYFVGGQAQGTLDFERLSACGNMLDGLGGDCGVMGTITISGGAASSCFCAPGGVSLDSPMLESVSIRATAGQIEVLEGGRIRFASLNKA
jgi:hypothetical protein